MRSALIPFGPGAKPKRIVTLPSLKIAVSNWAGNPALGRSCDEIRPGLRRMEQGRHVILYRVEPGGILISRILHQRMLPEKQDIDDDEDLPPG
jgi:plasmid stabilization system protein ParE